MSNIHRPSPDATPRSTTGDQIIRGLASIARVLDEHPPLVQLALEHDVIACDWIAGEPVTTLSVLNETKQRIAAVRSASDVMPGGPQAPRSCLRRAAA